MFRRKRYAAREAEMPWWTDDGSADPREQPHSGQYGYHEHGYHEHGYPDAGRPGAPPLTAHDPFGGWPAFAGDAGAGPARETGGAGWPAGPDGPPHPTVWPAFAGAPAPPQPPPIDPTDIEPTGPDPAHPLLTHPVGRQRFQPDLEAGPGPCAAPERPGGGRARRDSVEVEDLTTWLTPVTEPDPAEASALAGAFAADYLSWDQDDPRRRGQVLAQYLPSDVDGDPSLLGWSGKGRQRADFALPGVVRPDGEGRVMVDVRVRVTPFRRVGASARTATATGVELEVAGVPAAAPAPTAKGWRSLDAHWVRMTVPVLHERDRLVVDTWDERLDGTDSNRTDSGDAAGELVDPTTAEDTTGDTTGGRR